MSGTRDDGGPFRMAGVVIFEVSADAITSARFYLEPVEQTSGDVTAAVRRVLGHPIVESEGPTHDLSGSRPGSKSRPRPGRAS